MKIRFGLRYAALLMAVLMCAVCCSGCLAGAQLGGSLGKNSKAPAITQTLSPTAAPTGGNEAQLKALEALDHDIFAYAMQDYSSFLVNIKNPDDFGIEKPEVNWGSLSEEKNNKDIEQYEEFQARYNEIDASSFEEANRFKYDTMGQMLRLALEGNDLTYYYEPFDPLSGLHTNLPIYLLLFDIESEDDLRDYLTLLEDTPRFINELILYEKKRAELGIYMTESALDEVLKQIDDFSASTEESFLITGFQDKLTAAGELKANAEEYTQRNAAGTEAMLSSMRTLRAELDLLRSSCRGQVGAGAFSEDMERYYVMGIKDASSSDITPEECMKLLNSMVDEQIAIIGDCLTADSTLYEKYGKISLSVGTLEENVAYLKGLAEQYYPELSEHSINYVDVPKEMESQYPAAACKIPAIDADGKYTIILNQSQVGKNGDDLITLAHEIYPGHMYHYAFLNSLEGQSLSARAQSLTAYYEAWSMNAEDFFCTSNTRFDQNYCRYMEANNVLSNVLVAAVISVGVNYYGWSVDDSVEYLQSFYTEDGAKQMGDIYYSYAVSCPFYFLEYAMGYSQLYTLKKNIKTQLGSKFVLKEFNEKYLTYGPSYFNLLEDYMNKRAEGKK